MARTELRSGQVKEVGRSDLDTATPGNAVVSKIVAGTGVTISSTGADTGTGDVTVNASGGPGGGATGTADLAFGAFPGTTDVSVAVSGQAGIVAGSIVDAWLRPENTADHSADEHMLEELDVHAASIVAGTGFTVHGRARRGRIYGSWKVAWAWS